MTVAENGGQEYDPFMYLVPRKKSAFLQELIDLDYSASVIRAFEAVDRQLFVPSYVPSEYCYADYPWPLLDDEERSTISDPIVAAQMTHLLDPKPGDRVLEIGTGSGYQAAILKYLAGDSGRVVSIEYLPKVADLAKVNWQKAGISNIEILIGDILPEEEFDRIMVTCSFPPFFPTHPLLNHLKSPGRFVGPLGGFQFNQERSITNCRMFVAQKNEKGKLKASLTGKYSFVPMLGKNGWNPRIESHLPSELDQFLRRNVNQIPFLNFSF